MTDVEERRRLHDARRRAARPWRAWYGTAAWKRRRAKQLHRVPWCEPCKAMGKHRRATVANHNPPHGGDRVAFFHGPLESTCKQCHDQAIQGAEARGFRLDVDAEGWPTDTAHPFNRGAHLHQPATSSLTKRQG